MSGSCVRQSCPTTWKRYSKITICLCLHCFFFVNGRVPQVLAPALRAFLAGEKDLWCCSAACPLPPPLPLEGIARMQRADLVACVAASMQSLDRQLERVHSIVKRITRVKEQQESSAAQKFVTFKAAGGTADDFFCLVAFYIELQWFGCIELHYLCYCACKL